MRIDWLFLPRLPVRNARLRHLLQVFLPALATIALAGLLVFTVSFTAFDWEWIAFLSGVLSTAILALVSRASKSEWRIARRTAQLNQLKEKLANEIGQHTRTREQLEAEIQQRSRDSERFSQEKNARRLLEETQQLSRNQLQVLADALPVMVAYADQDVRCRFHNKAFREWLGLGLPEQVDGKSLSDVLGDTGYQELREQLGTALLGKQLRWNWNRPIKGSGMMRIEAEFVPHKDARNTVIGCFLLLADVTATKRLKPGAEAGAVAQAPAVRTGAESSDMEETGQGLYVASFTEHSTGWSNAAERLADALEKDEFRLYHQAILPLKWDQDHASIHEILIRLQEEEENMAPPGAFIPIAERYNMMPAIDRWVVRHVIGWHCKNRRTSGGAPMVLYSINLSSSTVADREFPDFVRKECDANNFPPQALCFEIAESEALPNLADASRFISKLKPLGCRFALDGFGETKVSFEHLKHVPVDFLKIDGNIIREILRDPVSLAKIKGIQRVCRTIGIRTIGLFVETQEVLDKLKELRVDYAQGFGIALPSPLDEVTDPSAL